MFFFFFLALTDDYKCMAESGHGADCSKLPVKIKKKKMPIKLNNHLIN